MRKPLKQVDPNAPRTPGQPPAARGVNRAAILRDAQPARVALARGLPSAAASSRVAGNRIRGKHDGR